MSLLLPIGCVGGVCLAAPADADPDSYLWNLENDSAVNFYGNKAALIDLGYRICADLYAGNTIAQETNVVLINPQFDFNYGAAREITLHAQENLC